MTRTRKRIALVCVLVVVLIVAIAFAAASDDEPSVAPSSTVDGNTQPTTSPDPSTTAASSTTTTTSSTTSRLTTTSSTTSRLTTTSSTTRPFVPRPTGKVIPYETGIYVKTTTLTAFAFGEESELVLNEMTAALGNADHDTGWRKDDTCEGSSTRRVRWGDLELVFTKGANGLLPDTLTFQQWHINGSGTLANTLVTPEGIGVGSTVGDLKDAYPESKVTRARSSDEAGIYLTKPEGGPFIQGLTKNTDDKSLITSMWAGLACQRILG